MAVTRKRGKGPNPKVMKEMREAFVDKATTHWDEHIGEALETLADAEEQVLPITFRATLNFKETKPKLTVRVSFTKSFSDEAVVEFDDPDQMPLGDIPDQATKKKRKKKGGDDGDSNAGVGDDE